MSKVQQADAAPQQGSVLPLPEALPVRCLRHNDAQGNRLLLSVQADPPTPR
jgi:hypothetical protein